MHFTTYDAPQVAADYTTIAEKSPFVYGLTNYIAANLSANVVLAAGAGPAIGAGADWTSTFPATAQGVWINTATVISNSESEIRTAAQTAHRAGTPWVLDPVAAGSAPEYDSLVKSLLAYRPTVIRGNASELVALAGGEGQGRGVETTLNSDQAVGHIEQLARDTGAVVAVSGPTDYITDGTDTVAVTGGDRRLTQVTGAGCSLGALTAAAVAAVEDPLRATVASHAAFARAAEIAAQTVGPHGGTGSFAVALVDGLHTLANADN